MNKKLTDLERAKALLDADPALVRRTLRIADSAIIDTNAILSHSDQAHAILAGRMDGLDYEEVHVICLNRRHRVLSVELITIGNDRCTIVDPRQIFRRAIELGASSVIIAHNHPTGDCTPSREDIAVTERVAAAGKVLGVALLDHLVICGDSYSSLRTLGYIGAGAETYGGFTG